MKNKKELTQVNFRSSALQQEMYLTGNCKTKCYASFTQCESWWLKESLKGFLHSRVSSRCPGFLQGCTKNYCFCFYILRFPYSQRRYILIFNIWNLLAFKELAWKAPWSNRFRLGIGGPSSNFSRDCYLLLCANTPEKSINQSLLSQARDKEQDRLR